MSEGVIYYSVRCDKHAFKPHDYCEMCKIRSELQNVVERSRSEVKAQCSAVALSISELQDLYEKLSIDIEYLKGFLNI